MSQLDQVLNQMQDERMPALPDGHPIMNGKIHRYGPGKKAWYSLREITLRSGKTIVGGAFGIWQADSNNAIKVKMDWKGVSPEERAAGEEKQREHDSLERKKKEKLAEFAANRARQQWDAAGKIDDGNRPVSAYLQRKQVTLDEARVAADGTLLVPMHTYSPEGSRLVGMQKIAPDGSKLFNKGMDKIGAACLLGGISPASPMAMVGEGYATLQSIRLATSRRYPAMVAFDAGNIIHVAQNLRRDFPGVHILFIADDDWKLEERFAKHLLDDFKVSVPVDIDGKDHEIKADDGSMVSVTASWKLDTFGDRYIDPDVRSGRQIRVRPFKNTGIFSAKTAAKAVGNASVVCPVFADRGENKWTDFNDLHVQQSIDDVSDQLQAAINSIGQAESETKKPKLELVKSPPPSEEKASGTSEGAASATAEGGGGKQKPKKEYGDNHWKTVDHLIDNFTLIYGDDTAWDGANRVLIRVANMRLAFGTDAVKFWLNNADRRMVNKDCVVFDPTLTSDPDRTVNLFNGFKTVPKEGSCEKIVQLLLHLCGNDAEVMAWVLRWIAYPLQNPGAKMRTSIITHGDEGSGKNLFWENVVGKIYGEYSGVIGNAQIESAFNEWASKKLFMVADEVVTRSELRQMKGKLKHMVTGETLMINPKGMSERAEANHMNFVFLSNELQPLALDKTDRRYLVLWTPPKLEEYFYKEVGEQIRNGGSEAFYHYLLHKVPCGDFNEHTKPIMNTAKAKLISLGMSPPERFYREWSEGFLPLPYVCCGAMQLYQAFCRWSILNGERYPASQTLFGRLIDRVAFDSGVRRSLIKYELGHVTKQRTVYLIGDEPKDKTRSEWVHGASELFEDYLRKYRNVFERAENE